MSIDCRPLFGKSTTRFDHRLFVGIREPARLAVFDTISGHLIVALPSAEDTDDLYYDAEHKRVYVPGGEGVIDIFQMNDPDHYRPLAKIPTSLADVPPDILEGKAKACIVSFWRFQLAAGRVPS